MKSLLALFCVLFTIITHAGPGFQTENCSLQSASRNLNAKAAFRILCEDNKYYYISGNQSVLAFNEETKRSLQITVKQTWDLNLQKIELDTDVKLYNDENGTKFARLAAN